MFGRVLGPFYVMVCAIAAMRVPDARPVLSDFGVWPWATGAFLLMGGLVIIAFHQYWRSVAAVMISSLGWLMALRGFFLLAFPATFTSIAGWVTGAGTLWRTIYICGAVIGLYLTYAGWGPAASQPAVQAKASNPDPPRLA